MNRQSSKWGESDLQSLVTTPVEESLELEYKAADAVGKSDSKKNEISKDVSAFANAAGGTLVYGIRESPGKPPRAPQSVEGIDPSEVSREWLEQVINSRIQPRIQGLLINPVALSGNLNGKVAYVLSIPQGGTAHQASDKKFYKRFNFQSVPMNYYEIRDVMNRVRHPDVTAEVGVHSRQPAEGYDQKNRVIIGLSLRLSNTGHRVADRVAVRLWIPEGYNLRGNYAHLALNRGAPIARAGKSYKVIIYHHRQPDGLFPLFPSFEHEIVDGSFAYVNLYLFKPREAVSRGEYLVWEVFADSAPPKEGQVPMCDLFCDNQMMPPNLEAPSPF